MSLVSNPDLDAGVLHHKAEGPAIALPRDPSDEELAFDWTLSPNDIAFVLRHRGRENVCRIAIQLCVLRKHGRFLVDYARITPRVLGYLCRQLDLEPFVALLGQARGGTESAYQAEIADYLGWQSFTDHRLADLSAWIAEQVAAHLYVENLVGLAEGWLRQRRIIIPGPVIFERQVNSAYRQAEAEVFRRLAAQIPPETQAGIDQLLTSPDVTKTDFFRFAEYPKAAKALHICRYLERYQALTRLGLHRLRFQGVGTELLRRLAAAAKTYDAWQIRRFDANKRYALAACFLYETQKTMLDHLVEMHAQFLTELKRHAKTAWNQQYHVLRKRVQRGVTSLRQLGIQVLAASPETTLGELFEPRDLECVRDAVISCEAFEDLERYGLVDQLIARYANFRRYFRAFATLNFHGEPGSERIMQALDILRRLDSGELKTLPDGIDLALVPAEWRKTRHQSIDRRSWELGLAFALKEALYAGDVYLPESRRHASFWDLCYDHERWHREKPVAYQTLGLPEEAERALARWVAEYEGVARHTASRLAANPFVDMTGNEWRFKTDEKLPEVEGTRVFRQLLEHSLQPVRIETLLLEVDALTGFSVQLTPPGSTTPDTSTAYRNLMAALVAHGTNLGIVAMAQSTDDITIDMLQHASRTRLRDETIRAANAVLVNYHRSLGVSTYWGDGTRSSSDGQRFAVQGSSLLSAFYPRYFGYYDRAVTIYTHTLDQGSVFSTLTISCAECEALYVVDGLLQNEVQLDIREHYTDTHGYTDQVFGLCYLLGFAFMPRIADFRHQTLYRPRGMGSFGKLDTLLTETVDLDLIKEQWDSLVRVAASLKHRVVSANVIARRLGRASGNNRLAKALTALGCLAKTVYLLRYIDDVTLRRRVELQLNRGEARHHLVKHVHFANAGAYRSGDYYDIMNKASCTSLISNAILVYNTLKIRDLLEQQRVNGNSFTPEAISRVSPLCFKHVVVNGTYDFSQAQARLTSMAVRS